MLESVGVRTVWVENIHSEQRVQNAQIMLCMLLRNLIGPLVCNGLYIFKNSAVAV